MSDEFEKGILTNVNSFRKNPQSIKHQIEVLHRGISRFKANDPFLLEIEDFLKTIGHIPKMQPVVINQALCDVAASEVKKYAKNEETYKAYRQGKELEGIIPEEYMAQNPALIADNGADEPDTIVPKLLLNRLDEQKKGRKILCTNEYSQFGVARIRHDDENYYIIIFAKGVPKVEGEVTLSVKQKDYVDNYLYYESKFITKKKNTNLVQHKRHGQIMGSSQGSGVPDIYENMTTMTKKEAAIYENVNKAFEMISPKKNGYVSRTFNIRRKKKEKIIEYDVNIIEKKEEKVIKIPKEKRKEKKERIKEEIKEEKKDEDKKEDIKEDKKESKKEKKIEKIIIEKEFEIIEDNKEEKKLIEQKVEEMEEDEQKEEKETGGSGSKIKSIRRRFYGSKRK